jgi:glycosyltransferase involved in cell wall biosynthesis
MDQATPPRQPNLIICVGRLHLSKGQHTLVRARALLRRANPSLPFTIYFVGDGPPRESCLHLSRELGIQGSCNFLGFRPHEEVIRLLASAAVKIVPSTSEAFGYVNIESLAVGTPVIASRVGGIVEIIRDGIDGYLVSPDDPETLSRRLQMLLTDDELRTSMSRRARERFLACFNEANVIPRHAEQI